MYGTVRTVSNPLYWYSNISATPFFVRARDAFLWPWLDAWLRGQNETSTNRMLSILKRSLKSWLNKFTTTYVLMVLTSSISNLLYFLLYRYMRHLCWLVVPFFKILQNVTKLTTTRTRTTTKTRTTFKLIERDARVEKKLRGLLEPNAYF